MSIAIRFFFESRLTKSIVVVVVVVVIVVAFFLSFGTVILLMERERGEREEMVYHGA